MLRTLARRGAALSRVGRLDMRLPTLRRLWLSPLTTKSSGATEKLRTEAAKATPAAEAALD